MSGYILSKLPVFNKSSWVTSINCSFWCIVRNEKDYYKSLETAEEKRARRLGKKVIFERKYYWLMLVMYCAHPNVCSLRKGCLLIADLSTNLAGHLSPDWLTGMFIIIIIINTNDDGFSDMVVIIMGHGHSLIHVSIYQYW